MSHKGDSNKAGKIINAPSGTGKDLKKVYCKTCSEFEQFGWCDLRNVETEPNWTCASHTKKEAA